jgi:hypothetical protein
VYKRPEALLAIVLGTTFNLQSGAFLEWAMLGSNQRPLPCESSSPVTAAYRSLREMGFLRGFCTMSANSFYTIYRRFMPALLHGCCTSAVNQSFVTEGRTKPCHRHTTIGTGYLRKSTARA